MTRDVAVTDELILRPTVDRFSGLIVPVLLAAFVLWLALDTKLVAIHAERDAHGQGHCAVVEQWGFGDRWTLFTRTHDVALDQVHVDFQKHRSSVSARLVGPGFNVKFGGESEGHGFEGFLQSHDAATYDVTDDWRGVFDVLLLAMLGVSLLAVPAFVTSTVVADRRQGTLRVTYRFLGLSATREARLGDIREAWADPHVKREDQLFVRLRDGRKMRLSFPFTPISDRERVARSINAFLAP